MSSNSKPISSSQPLANGQTLPLWPGIAPGTPENFPPQCISERSSSVFHPDRELTSISCPGLTVVLPDAPNGVSVIAAPGGGYSRIAMDKEGREIGDWLSGLGVTTFLMTYRLPDEGHQNGSDVPLQDAQRAMRLVRSNAQAWGLDPQKIGFMGGSAAGHMAASLVTGYERKVYETMDAADAVSARPDFSILMYPVITMTSDFVHEGSRERLIGADASEELIRKYSPQYHATGKCPEVFFVLSDADTGVLSDNSILMYQALKRAGVKAEMHIFRDGEHGFGIERVAHLPARHWPTLCAEWMARIGVLQS